MTRVFKNEAPCSGVLQNAGGGVGADQLGRWCKVSNWVIELVCSPAILYYSILFSEFYLKGKWQPKFQEIAFLRKPRDLSDHNNYIVK